MPSFLKIKDIEHQVTKLIDCTNYQCCEHDEWKQSNSYAFLSKLKEQILSLKPDLSSYKFHDSLSWDWEISETHSAVVEYPDGRRALVSDEETFDQQRLEHQAFLVGYYGDLTEAQAWRRYSRTIMIIFLFKRQPSLTFAQAVE